MTSRKINLRSTDSEQGAAAKKDTALRIGGADQGRFTESQGKRLKARVPSVRYVIRIYPTSNWPELAALAVTGTILPRVSCTVVKAQNLD